MKKEQDLITIDFHDWRPSSIATSIDFHMKEHGNWFWINVQCHQFIHSRSVEKNCVIECTCTWDINKTEIIPLILNSRDVVL